jgi:aryl-alcohol dehydrogenase-like predicted oxidoreductase
MGMSYLYGPTDEAQSIRTIQKAIDQGVEYIDTGDFYGSGHNEMLIAKALEGGRRQKAILSVKFGALRGPDHSWLGMDARAASVKNALACSLQRLKTDYIDIYRLARLDPNVPIEETVGAMADMVKAGYVRKIGLSEVGVETLKRASKVAPIADLQMEYSIMSRSAERAIFPAMKELGGEVSVYGVLSRGLLAGTVPQSKDDYRLHLPRFEKENLERNLRIISQLRELAVAHHLSLTQLCVAWVFKQSSVLGLPMVAVLGCRREAQLDEILGATHVDLSHAVLQSIQEIMNESPVAGDRYAPMQMAHLDSER